MNLQRNPGWSRLLAVLGVLLAGGCPPAERPETVPRQRSMEELKASPLYTFTEEEVDRYLQALPAAEPVRTDRILHLGRKNIGQPYDIYLLGEFPFELIDPEPIYCLDRSDCVVFSEHMFAMGLSRNWWEFLAALQRIRYRDGKVGMLTRNHYTIADWDRNNAFLFEDMTPRLGDGTACVPLTRVCRRANFFAKHGIGQDIPDEPIQDTYIPSANVSGILQELQNADFVNIIRGSEESQYAGHTGLIAIGHDGTVNFLHSSQPAVREQPLLEYLQKDRRCLGIKILRLRPGAEQILRDTLASSQDATDVSERSLKAALAASPLMSTGAPEGYAEDWTRAMRMQAYQLKHDTPVDTELQKQVDAIERRGGEELGIPEADRAFGVLDLTGRRLALVRPDVTFYGASVPKIAIVFAYFAKHPEAARDLDPQVERELQLVIKRSDNDLAAKYSQLVGLDFIQKLLTSKEYRLYDKEHGGGLWCGKHYGVDEPRFGDPLNDHSHGASVRQCLRYYLMLEQGELVNAEVCAKIKEIFAAPHLEFHNDRFVGGLNGRDVTILRKSGWWEDWHLDTARVVHGKHLYFMAGMAQHPKGEEYLAQMARAVDEVICGREPKPRPFAHELILHDPETDFGRASGGPNEGQPVIAIAPPTAGAESAYESPVVEPELEFNEALLSWNVDVPDEATVRVELRVGRLAYDTWSPWLTLAQWGPGSFADEPLMKSEQGNIDKDYFRSTDWYDRLQYRLRVTGTSQAVGIRRVGVCVSDTTGIPTALPRPKPVREPVEAAAWQRTLPVPFRSQRTDDPQMKHGICSPTSVGMVMEYRGVSQTNETIAQRAFDARHRIYGNWPMNVQAAYTFGVPGYVARFSDWDDVRAMIAAGNPLVISIVAKEGELHNAPYKSTDGHLIVITGFADADHVTVNDPAARTARAGQRKYSTADLETVWMRAKGGTAYVLLPPQP